MSYKVKVLKRTRKEGGKENGDGGGRSVRFPDLLISPRDIFLVVSPGLLFLAS